MYSYWILNAGVRKIVEIRRNLERYRKHLTPKWKVCSRIKRYRYRARVSFRNPLKLYLVNAQRGRTIRTGSTRGLRKHCVSNGAHILPECPHRFPRSRRSETSSASFSLFLHSASGPPSRPLNRTKSSLPPPRTNPPRDTQRHSPTVPLRETKMVTTSALCVFEKRSSRCIYLSAVIYASVIFSATLFACNLATRQGTRIFILGNRENEISTVYSDLWEINLVFSKNYLEDRIILETYYLCVHMCILFW